MCFGCTYTVHASNPPVLFVYVIRNGLQKANSEQAHRIEREL